MQTLQSLIDHIINTIATNNAEAAEADALAEKWDGWAKDARNTAAEARRTASEWTDALARLRAPAPVQTTEQPTAATAGLSSAMSDVASAMQAIAGPGPDHGNRGHMPIPGGRWVKRAETFEADNREGVRRLRALMAGGEVRVDDAIALFPPADGKQIMLGAWIFREGWVRDNRPTGAVYRRANPGTDHHTNWLKCVGRLA